MYPQTLRTHFLLVYITYIPFDDLVDDLGFGGLQEGARGGGLGAVVPGADGIDLTDGLREGAFHVGGVEAPS